MLPTLGQLITPTTDVTVEENYEIAVLDSDGSRRVLAREHFLPISTVERTLEIYGPNPLVFWAQATARRSIPLYLLPDAKGGISPIHLLTGSPSCPSKTRSTRSPTSKTS